MTAFERKNNLSPSKREASLHYHISPDRAAYIAEKTERLWYTYCRSDSVCGPNAFFDPEVFTLSKKKPVYGAEEFFNFCSGITRIRFSFDVKLRIVHKLEAQQTAPVNPGRISRWVLIANKNAQGDVVGSPITVVLSLHHEALPSHGPTGFLINPYLAWTWNLLHEAGHLVLHSQKFVFDNRLVWPLDRPIADEVEEQEAWFFAASVVGLALGSSAFIERLPRVPHRGQKFGAPWELVAWTEQRPKPSN